MKSPRDQTDYLKTYWKDYRHRIRRVYITLDNDQFQTLSERASREGLKPTTFATKVIEAELEKKPFLSSALHEELKAVSFLIRNIANSVNQTVHHSHVMRQLVNENDLLGELRKLEAAVKEYTLGRFAQADDDH